MLSSLGDVGKVLPDRFTGDERSDIHQSLIDGSRHHYRSAVLYPFPARCHRNCASPRFFLNYLWTSMSSDMIKKALIVEDRPARIGLYRGHVVLAQSRARVGDQPARCTTAFSGRAVRLRTFWTCRFQPSPTGAAPARNTASTCCAR